MHIQHARRLSRRSFLGGVTLTGMAGLLGMRPRRVAAEPPPETTTLRLARTTSICQAPQYVVEALFEAEGFTDVQFVGTAAAPDRTLVSGDAQMGMLFLGPFLLRLDEGAPCSFSPAAMSGASSYLRTSRSAPSGTCRAGAWPWAPWAPPRISSSP
jgi:NitT/TauT family transport system substrate-binding protein